MVRRMDTETLPDSLTNKCRSALDSNQDVYVIIFSVLAVVTITALFFRKRIVNYFYIVLLNELFGAADANGDGSVDLGELHAAVLILYVSMPGLKVIPPSRRAIKAAVFEPWTGFSSKGTLDRVQFRWAMGLLVPQFILRTLCQLVLLPLSAFLGPTFVEPAIRFAYSRVDVPWIDIDQTLAGLLGPCEMGILRSAIPKLFWLYDWASTNYHHIVVPALSVLVSSYILLPFFFNRADAAALKQHARSSGSSKKKS